MPLSLKTTQQFVDDEIAAINAQLSGQFQFPEGSYTRATVDAHARVGIWQESNIELVFSSIRLTTSIGNAVDTFLADFDLIRLPAVAASGNVTLSSNTPTAIRTVNVGQTVSQFDNVASYAVIADPNNTYYDPDLLQYIIPANVAAIDVPIVCAVGGIIGNCSVGAISVINSPIVGIDTVTNALPFINGVDAQTDPQAKAYFLAYINSLTRATKAAIEFSVESVEGVQQFTVQENLTYPALTIELGRIFAVIDDGTGTPPDSLVTAVLASVALYRGLAIRYDVYKPVVVIVTISATITLPVGYSDPDLNDDIETALDVYIAAIPFGETLFYTRIAQVIYNAIFASLSDQTLFDQFNVSSVLLNGSATDLPSTVVEKFIIGDAIAAVAVTTSGSYASIPTLSATLGTGATFTPRMGILTSAVATAQSGAGNYAPGDINTITGGTFTVAATLTVTHTKVVSATIAAGGTGGTPGTQTVTGTTGTGTKFQASVTVSGGGVITAILAITVAGDYTVNPSSLTNEPVTGASLSGAQLAVKMGVLTYTVSNAGAYSALPTNPVATTSSGAGTGFTANVNTWQFVSVAVLTGGQDYTSDSTIIITGGGSTGGGVLTPTTTGINLTYL